ncbi:ArsR/SmtB family transcription factor [Lysinibacillus xylanilyticus]|uniref:Metalloregulator ArsR/SmtB family transcription factor n=1 Tax=Lysinibacillus xylanilyticus TaxID=582475 RepID=A0ABT4ESG1_9BACI|nr:metalloregulator ArsR/SmtB family transcription factor [Lysinibacillus xylanilyticus]MCY9548570.1 metalloregulator ArsR/SmtB family transcription factor [Lysinibacillus xylanilyticus]MED3800551.1 metalloregulator ArsR/SmtB family transcription factor [Lysinibacillus xylanilyticus]
MPKEVCEITHVDEEAVIMVQQQMPDLSRVAKFLKALSDETRLKIAYALTVKDELCVCDVASIIGSSVATASHHLRYLKDNNLAKSNRKGKQMYYSLADEHVYQIVTVAYEHVKEGIANGGDTN